MAICPLLGIRNRISPRSRELNLKSWVVKVEKPLKRPFRDWTYLMVDSFSVWGLDLISDTRKQTSKSHFSAAASFSLCCNCSSQTYYLIKCRPWVQTVFNKSQWEGTGLDKMLPFWLRKVKTDALNFCLSISRSSCPECPRQSSWHRGNIKGMTDSKGSLGRKVTTVIFFFNSKPILFVKFEYFF